MTNQQILDRLTLPPGKLRMVLDTDTYNEVDDQFALAYALASPERLQVEAVYAAPFHNARSTGPKDGMEKSYEEILRLLDKMSIPSEGFVHRGSDAFMGPDKQPVDSPAARDLIARAKAMPAGEALYVVAIGAITNVASALLLDPSITQNIVVVWLGGNPLSYPTTQEFNLSQDIPSVQVVLDSTVPMIMVPCWGVSSHLLTSLPELEKHLGGKNAICDALIELYAAYSEDHFAYGKEIWDISVIGYLINPDWVPASVEASPILTPLNTWSRDPRRHLMKVAYFCYRNPIFADLFKKLAQL